MKLYISNLFNNFNNQFLNKLNIYSLNKLNIYSLNYILFNFNIIIFFFY